MLSGGLTTPQKCIGAGIVQAPVSDPAMATISLALRQIGLAMVEMERGNHAEARALLETAAPALQNVPKIGYFIPAVRVYSDALSGFDTPDALQARIHAERQRVAEAMAIYPDPTDGKRHYGEILLFLAQAFFAAGNPAECLQTLEPLATGDAVSPGMLPRWHFWRGRAYEATGDTPAARREYENAIRIGEPENRYVRDAQKRLAAPN